MSEFSEIVKMLWEESSVYYGNSLANANTGPRYGDTTLDPDRKLTGKFQDYLTGLIPSAKTIPDHICGICYHDKSEAGTCSIESCLERNHNDFYTGGFRKECEDIGDD